MDCSTEVIFDLAVIDIAADEFEAALVRRVKASGKPITDNRHVVKVATEVAHRVLTLRSRLLASTVETMVLALSYVEPRDWVDTTERAAILIAIFEQGERLTDATPPYPATQDD